MSVGHLILARFRSCKSNSCHCRKDWVGWQTKKSGLVSRCLWPSSHAPPDSAEREEVAQPGNMTPYCVPSSELFLQSKPNQLEASSAGQPSLLLPSQENLGNSAREQVQNKPVLTGPVFVHFIGLTIDVRLPETCTSLYAGDAVNLQTAEWS